MVRIFGWSVDLYNMQYSEFFGDGDSKSFGAVENVYKKKYGVVVKKKECVGHVQKHCGTNMRKAKKGKKVLVAKEN